MPKKEWWKQLQPLRIPSGWTIMFNKLEDLEVETLSEEDTAWLTVFVEDIMYLYKKNKRKRKKQIEEQTISIDLGWYPDGDVNGSFRLIALLNHNWDEPLLEFSSRNKDEIVQTLEHWLFDELMSNEFMDENTFRKNHMNKL